jgi:hypothetical protein
MAEPIPHPATVVASTEIPDPFDLESLALGQDFAETVGVTKVLKTVPVRRPNSQAFVRVHPNLAPALASELMGETVQKTVFTAINRVGDVFLWPVTIPTVDGRTNEWWRSEREAAVLAISNWVRIKANISHITSTLRPAS